jgi:rhodanese-related sulfurtransferase
MRRQARRVFHRVPQLQNSQFLSICGPGAILVDLRPVGSFVRGFIPGSYSLSNLKWLTSFRRNLLPEQRTVYLIAESDVTGNLKRRFSKHKFEIAGCFHPGLLREWQANERALESIEELDPQRLTVRLAAWKTVVVDLRDRAAFRAAHMPEALNFALDNLRASVAGLPHETPLTVVCETGERSCFAASLLWNLNYRKLAILSGGFQSYLESGMPLIRK